MTDDVGDVTAPDAEVPAGRPGRPSVLVVGVAIAAVLLAAVSALAWTQWDRARDMEASDERVEAASLAAGRFVTELLGYDHADMEVHEQGVIALATDRFVTEYERALDGGLRDNIVALEAVATATVRDVFIGAPDGNRIQAVVVVDTEVVSRTGTRRLVGAYLQVTLDFDEDSGQWRADEVTSVATLDEVLVPPEGEPTPAPSPVPTGSPSPAPTGSPSP